MRIGIDATNMGDGGGVTHLNEILSNLIKHDLNNNISKVIVIGSQKILNQLTTSENIEKITFPSLNKGIIARMYFQIFFLDKVLKNKCDILFSPTGDYIGNFNPLVVMSQNMLLYERDIWKEINQFKEVFRFWLIFQKQKIAFNKSNGIIFISEYAKNYISKQLDLKNKPKIVIHHGISPRFINKLEKQKQISEYSFSNPFNFLYVSTIHVYKHQWNVVEAVSILRAKGYPIVLNLVGGVIYEPSGKKLLESIQKNDEKNEFIFNHGHLSFDIIETYYKKSDAIIFASTCENMPNILIESMASGKPIACSNKQPMPEFLKENGFYFDARDVRSIEMALEKLLKNKKLREKYTFKNIEEAIKYNWIDTSKETFNFIEKIYKQKIYVQK